MPTSSELHQDGSSIDFALGMLVGYLLGLFSGVFFYLLILLFTK